MQPYQATSSTSYFSYSQQQQEQQQQLLLQQYRLPPTPNSTSPQIKNSPEHFDSSDYTTDYPREVTWLFFRDSKWIPFQANNHHKIEQAFTLGGIYVDINDFNFPQLKTIRVFPTRMYLSYLGLKYRLSCVMQG